MLTYYVNLMNYNKEVTAYSEHIQFFNDCAFYVMDFCKKSGIDYHIKNGTIRMNNPL